jgi:hypothetical protein
MSDGKRTNAEEMQRVPLYPSHGRRMPHERQLSSKTPYEENSHRVPFPLE